MSGIAKTMAGSTVAGGLSSKGLTEAPSAVLPDDSTSLQVGDRSDVGQEKSKQPPVLCVKQKIEERPAQETTSQSRATSSPVIHDENGTITFLEPQTSSLAEGLRAEENEHVIAFLIQAAQNQEVGNEIKRNLRLLPNDILRFLSEGGYRILPVQEADDFGRAGLVRETATVEPFLAKKREALSFLQSEKVRNFRECCKETGDKVSGEPQVAEKMRARQDLALLVKTEQDLPKEFSFLYGPSATNLTDLAREHGCKKGGEVEEFCSLVRELNPHVFQDNQGSREIPPETPALIPNLFYDHEEDEWMHITGTRRLISDDTIWRDILFHGRALHGPVPFPNGVCLFREKIIAVPVSLLPDPALGVGHYRVLLHEIGHALDDLLRRSPVAKEYEKRLRELFSLAWQKNSFLNINSSQDPGEFVADGLAAYHKREQDEYQEMYKSECNADNLAAKTPEFSNFIGKEVPCLIVRARERSTST